MSNPSAPCPAIETYSLRSAGPAPRWLAVYVDDQGVRLSATFEGQTEAEAYGKACAFWKSEQLAIAKARIARGEQAA